MSNSKVLYWLDYKRGNYNGSGEFTTEPEVRLLIGLSNFDAWQILRCEEGKKPVVIDKFNCG